MANNNQFRRLEPPNSKRYLGEWRNGEVRLESIVCSKHAGHQRSGRRLDPLSINVPDANLPDFIWTWYSECLVHEQVARILRAEAVSGYELRPVQMFVNDKVLSSPEFWEVVVTGWGGMARPESGVNLISRCSFCDHQVYSCFVEAEQLIDESEWDGSDVFIIWPLPKYIFVTDRVARILNTHGFTGFDLHEMSHLKCTGTLTPGRMSYFMPEKRAHEIGDRLKIA